MIPLSKKNDSLIHHLLSDLAFLNLGFRLCPHAIKNIYIWVGKGIVGFKKAADKKSFLFRGFDSYIYIYIW